MNAQALAWCTEVANVKPKLSLGMAPEAAYVMEKPYLSALPSVLPAVYEVFERVVDLYGFVSVDSRDNHPNEQDDKGDEQTKNDCDPA